MIDSNKTNDNPKKEDKTNPLEGIDDSEIREIVEKTLKAHLRQSSETTKLLTQIIRIFEKK